MFACQSRCQCSSFVTHIPVQIGAIRKEYEILVRDATQEYRKRESELTAHLDTTLAREITATGGVMSQLSRLMSSNQPVSENYDSIL